MRRRYISSDTLFWPAHLAAFCLALAPLAAEANQFVKLDYNLTLNSRSRDTVFIELFDDKPITTSNFMAYVNGGKYNGMFMHRLSHGFVMQGGAFYPQYQIGARTDRHPLFAQIKSRRAGRFGRQSGHAQSRDCE